MWLRIALFDGNMPVYTDTASIQLLREQGAAVFWDCSPSWWIWLILELTVYFYTYISITTSNDWHFLS